MNRFSGVDVTNDEDYRQLIGWRKFYPRSTESSILATDSIGNSLVVEIGEELDIPVANTSAAVPKRPEYFGDFAHFSDIGAEIVAREFVEKIIGLEINLKSRN